jgi:hypothetical protein
MSKKEILYNILIFFSFFIPVIYIRNKKEKLTYKNIIETFLSGIFVVTIRITSDIFSETTFLFLFVILIPILIVIITFIKTGHKLQRENANMNFSLYGTIIYLYMKTILLNINFSNFTNKIKKIPILLLIFLLILFGLFLSLLPQFSNLEEVFKPSTSLILVEIEVIVLTVLVLGLFYFLLLTIYFAFYELVVEILFRRKMNKIVKERKKISLYELSKETGVLENDLYSLLKNWFIKSRKDTDRVDKETRKLIKDHVQIDIKNKELSWQE